MKINLLTTLAFLAFCGFQKVKSQSATIQVSGIPYSYNSQDSVPLGLFGVHSTSLTAQTRASWGIEMVRGIEAGPSGSPSFPGKNSVFLNGIKMTIDCYYDRFQPALYLSNRNGWQSQLENLATTYANASLSMTHKPIMEFWNEPFLNWASKPGANYDNRWYDTSNAVVGGKVFRPGFATPEKHLTWDRKKWFVQVSPPVNDPVNFYVQLGSNWTALNNLAVGQELQIGSRRFKAVMAWLAKDTNQLSYYSSLANAEMYVKMYKVYAQKLKSINPNLRVLAGWGMSFSNDNWLPWRTIYKTTVDSCWRWMDGIHEHHYGGDTRFMTGAYEVVQAYCQHRYKKKMPIFNTEAGGFTDPQIPGNTTPGPPSDPLLRDRGAFQFTFRELIFNLSRSPGKLLSRAAHEAHLNKGDGMAFTLLREFRGKLISCKSSLDNAWVASALNGNKLVVAVYNDQTATQTLQLKVVAPQGFVFTGGKRVWVEDSSAGNTIVSKVESFAANGTEWEQNLPLALKSGSVLTFEMVGALQAGNMNIQQYFADTILAKVPVSGNMETKISIPDSAISGIQAAKLKLYIRNLGIGTLLFNGNAFNIPTNAFFAEIFVPTNTISTTNTLIFNSNGTAYDVNMASLELINGNLDSNLITASIQAIEKKAFDFELFPNPANHQLSISFPGLERSLPFAIFDAKGLLVLNGNAFSGEQIHLDALKSGVYFFKCKEKVKKLVLLK